MLLIRLRVRPCRLRLIRSSSGRVTFTALALSSYSTRMLRWYAISNLPLGPSTKTLPGSTFTLTPDGTTTGCLPIRDTDALLPDRAEHFAAQLLGPGLPVAHHALVGADHRDAQPFEHRLQLRAPLVNAAARLADPVQTADHLLLRRAVFQED